MTDILEELDRWIAEWRSLADFRQPALPRTMLLQRARDEIAALRAARLGEWGTTLIAKARAEALEEASLAAEACCREFPACGVAVVAIRALKARA